jgi:hypothetical protein
LYLISNIVAPVKNIDNSDTNENIINYYYFVKQASSEEIVDISNLRAETKIAVSSGQYYVGIIAYDNAKNPFVKIRDDLGSNVFQIKEEYDSADLLRQLANVKSISIS